MKYMIDTNNNPFVFEDNVTQDIITKVEGTHNTKLTAITEEEYIKLITPSDEELAQMEQGRINSEARAYLESTDWYVVRETETGVAVPDEIKQLRAEARTKIV